MYPLKLDLKSQAASQTGVTGNKHKQTLHFTSLQTCPSFICLLNPHRLTTMELCCHLLSRNRNCRRSFAALFFTLLD